MTHNHANAPPSADDVIERWNRHAELYATGCSKYGDRNKEVLSTPVILKMLGHVAGKRVLDAGCGEGYLSRLLAESGASVTAVDYSQAFLDIARKRTPDDTAIEYVHANLEQLDGLGDSVFDVVVSSLVIQGVPHYQAAIAEIFRVLRPGGTCVLAMTHPCFSSAGAWVKDAAGRKLYWKIDHYFDERASEIPWPPDADSTPLNFHRTLTSYFRALIDTGFVIEDLEEPQPSQEAIEKYPTFADDLRMAKFLVFRLRKPPMDEECR
jgi:ubiquinone/menaquinone biosynthesis C-methylase UbiE